MKHFFLFFSVFFISTVSANDQNISGFDGLDWGVSKRHIQSVKGSDYGSISKNEIFYSFEGDREAEYIEGIAISGIYFTFEGDCDGFFSQCDLTEGFYSLNKIGINTLQILVNKLSNKYGGLSYKNSIFSPSGTGTQLVWLKNDFSYVLINYFPDDNATVSLRTYLMYGSPESGEKKFSKHNKGRSL
jgi:hypothetical protein